MTDMDLAKTPAAGKTSLLIVVMAALLSLYQLWQPVAGFVPAEYLPHWLAVQGATYFRPAHLGWVLVLGFLVYPLSALRSLRFIDYLFAAIAAWATFVVLNFDYRGIDHLLNGLSTVHYAAGLTLIALTLELSRRAIGPVMMIIGLVFLAYAAFGNLLPDALATRGFSFERIVRFQVFTGAGLFGSPLGIAAGAVFMFVLFGAFLESTGAGKFFIDLAFAAAGKYRGGPAKASVLASAAMGSISGSAIANTVTTGSLTIPMMKELGYSPEESAGIEAAASTGGQIMPPVMGAGAFVMAASWCPMADSCSAAKKRWLSEHTRTAGSAMAPEKRNSVSCSKECCAPMLRNCFGNSALDKGHRRVPMPPARMTGVNAFFDVFMIVCILAELVD